MKIRYRSTVNVERTNNKFLNITGNTCAHAQWKLRIIIILLEHAQFIVPQIYMSQSNSGFVYTISVSSCIIMVPSIAGRASI